MERIREAENVAEMGETSLRSGWLIEYADGSKEIMCEDEYKDHPPQFAINHQGTGVYKKGKRVICESHYFGIGKAILRNPDAEITIREEKS